MKLYGIMGLSLFLWIGTAWADSREEDTPRLIQVTDVPLPHQLPSDGASYCVPTATTMALYYLTAQGFANLSPTWDSEDLGPAYNLDRVIAGLVGTSIYDGTGPDGWKSGLQTYLNLQGYHGVATASLAFDSGGLIQDLSVVADGIQTNGLNDSHKASLLLLSWFTGSDGNYTSASGHAVTLVGVESSPGNGNVTIHNPEPAALDFGVRDNPEHSQQTFSVGEITGTFTGGAGGPFTGTYLMLDVPNPPEPRIGVLGNVLTVTIANSITPGDAFVARSFPIDGTLEVDTNGGNLTATAPLENGTSPGGLMKLGVGELRLTADNSTTGANSVMGGTLASILTSSGSNIATPFGKGNLTIGGGATVAVRPLTDSDGIADIHIAGDEDRKITIAGGRGTLSVDGSHNDELHVRLGGEGSNSDARLNLEPDATFFLQIQGGAEKLGDTVHVRMAGSGTNLPPVWNNVMVTPAIVGNFSNDDLTFLTYDDGFKRAAATEQSSFVGVTNNELLRTTGAINLGSGTGTAGALIADHDITGGTGSTLQLGAAGQGASGLILNGAALQVTNLNFTGDAYIHAGGEAVSSITAALASDALILSAYGSSRLDLSASTLTVGQIWVNGGQVAIGHATAPIWVQPDSTLTVSGTASGPVSVAAGSTLRLDHGTVTGPLNLEANSEDSKLPDAILAGTGTVEFADALALTGTLGSTTEAGALTFQNNTADNTVTLDGALVFTLESLKDDADGLAGVDWSSINFTGAEGTLTIGGTAQVIVQMSFTSETAPNFSDPFWQEDHVWTFFDIGNLGLTAGAPNWRISNENIFAFEELGFFSLNENNQIVYEAVPEPSTAGLLVLGLGLAVGCWKLRRNALAAP